MRLPDFKRGDTFELPLTLAFKNLGVSPPVLTPVDLTTCDVRMSAREGSAEGRIVQRFTFTVTDALAGKGVLSAESSKTKLWPLGPIVLDILVVDAADKEITSQTLNMMVGERVTR